MVGASAQFCYENRFGKAPQLRRRSGWRICHAARVDLTYGKCLFEPGTW